MPFDIDGLLLTTDGIHDFITLDKLSETFIAKKNTNQSFNLFKKTYLNGSLDDKTFLYAKIFIMVPNIGKVLKNRYKITDRLSIGKYSVVYLAKRFIIKTISGFKNFFK